VNTINLEGERVEISGKERYNIKRPASDVSIIREKVRREVDAIRVY